MTVPPAALALAPVHQHYLLEARQMQALSLVVHIPLVCFGIAFPAMVLFVEWLYLRRGDELYRVLAAVTSLAVRFIVIDVDRCRQPIRDSSEARGQNKQYAAYRPVAWRQWRTLLPLQGDAPPQALRP